MPAGASRRVDVEDELVLAGDERPVRRLVGGVAEPVQAGPVLRGPPQAGVRGLGRRPCAELVDGEHELAPGQRIGARVGVPGPGTVLGAWEWPAEELDDGVADHRLADVGRRVGAAVGVVGGGQRGPARQEEPDEGGARGRHRQDPSHRGDGSPAQWSRCTRQRCASSSGSRTAGR